MEIKYNVTGERRKALVKVISGITGADAVYKYMPTCSYEIDIFTVTKDGTLLFDDRSDSEEVEMVLDGIAAAGFECEAAQDADSGNTAALSGDAGELPAEPQDAAQDADSGDTVAFAGDAEELPAEAQDAAQGADSGDVAAFAEDAEELPTEEKGAAQGADGGDTAAFAEDAEELPTEEKGAAQGTDGGDTAAPSEEAGLTVSLPLNGFGTDAHDRLNKLVKSKATLIRKALGTAHLDIQTDEEKVSFPWWDTLPEPEETRAYTAFIAALCRMAKESKRVLATEKEVESEKYAFRGFLLRLGFIGAECKEQRRLLLKNLSGSSAFPNREKADAFSAAQKAKRDAAKAAIAMTAAAMDTGSSEEAAE